MVMFYDHGLHGLQTDSEYLGQPARLSGRRRSGWAFLC